MDLTKTIVLTVRGEKMAFNPVTENRAAKPPANLTPQKELLARDVNILFSEVNRLREENERLKEKLKQCKS